MGRFTGKTCRLLTMMALTTSFFLVEIVTGYATKSVALVADSFHMLSDIISLIVGFTAIKMSTKSTSKNTYGWQRAEVLGALVNAVFLIALCFTIVVESVQRFVIIEEIEQPVLVLIVGGIGLLINGVGLCLFSTHGLGHGHSHGGGGGHGHSHGKPKTKAVEHPTSPNGSATDFNYSKVSQADVSYQSNGFSYSHIDDNGSNQNQNSSFMQIYSNEEDAAKPGDADESEEHTAIEITPSKRKDSDGGTGSQLNMRGVFLHVLGDALGSVVVIISALIIWLTDGDWRFYVDPAMSLIIVFIIISTTIPLFKQSSMILMQSIPTDVDIEDIEERLMSKVHGIQNIHEFHIWQLSGNKIIATAHIRFKNIHDYVQAAQEMKTFLHDEGIHSTTIQAEFSDDMMSGEESNSEANCMLMCQPDGCRHMTCCNDNQSQRRKSTGSIGASRKKSPSRKSSSVLSRTLQKVRVRSVASDKATVSHVDSSKVPLLRNVASTSKQETAMGTTTVTAPTTPTTPDSDIVERKIEHSV